MSRISSPDSKRIWRVSVNPSHRCEPARRLRSVDAGVHAYIAIDSWWADDETEKICDYDSSEAREAFAAILNRRQFLGRLGQTTALAMGSGLLGAPRDSDGAAATPRPLGSTQLSSNQRRNQAYEFRHEAALYHLKVLSLPQRSNGDEALYRNKIASYSKGLPHNGRGEVDLNAFNAMTRALASGVPADFELIPMGCADGSQRRRLVNPQAGLAFELEGADVHELAIPPAPAFASAEQAAEIVENYWMALLRDLPFHEYDSHPMAQAAASDLDRLSGFRGPRSSGRVTTRTLFRGLTPGDVNGPYLSQFFWLPAPYGANFVEQKLQTIVAGLDYMTSYDDWLAVQNGCQPRESDRFEPARRYIINGRDLGQWVHIDVLFQAYFVALLCMVKLGVPPNPGNPYLHSATQEGFGTFGGPYFATLLCEVATRALKAQWFQKWFVHRRLRPEAYAGRVHLTLTRSAQDPIHRELLNSSVLPLIADHNAALNGGTATYLLPQAFPEGSPLHPSYGAGHATVAGACVTILKALFDESFVITNPVVPNATGSALIPYTGPALTIGGELDKIASNVALGRNIAGVHWRSDATESLKLGEAVAINILRDQRASYNENFDGFTFTKFDGARVTV